MVDNNLGIYIHVPFCMSKCPYCNFYSLTNTENIGEFTRTVCNEIKNWGIKLDKTVDTIYFGGGTPSILPSDNVVEILQTVNNSFFVKTPEITLEVNPANYGLLDFRKLNFFGVNRISLGAQSFENSQLRILGRNHNRKDIFSAIDVIKSAGIKNISLDIILGTPGQKLKYIDDFIDYCEENSITHISAYMLKIEEGTPYYLNKNNFKFFCDDDIADMYLHICKLAKKREYEHYEISNFAKKGFESKHNLKYWRLKNYLGIGPSAHSLVDGKRFYYPNNLFDFVSNPRIIVDGECEREKEFMMLGLRMKSGITNESFKNVFGRNIPDVYFKRAKKFEKYGLINLSNDKISLTTRGFLLSNYIISEII
ncbi:MAG: radical SAM family heme chaperone HemW [Acutalibacteraceae bacterium]